MSQGLGAPGIPFDCLPSIQEGHVTFRGGVSRRQLLLWPRLGSQNEFPLPPPHHTFLSPPAPQSSSFSEFGT